MPWLMRLRSWIRILCAVLATVGAMVLVAMMVLVTVDVGLRDLVNEAILGTYELVEYMMVVVVFLAFGLCQMRDSHITVDVVECRLPHRARAILKSVTLLLTMAVFVPMAWVNLDQTATLVSTKQASMVLLIPRWPFQAVAVVGLAAFSLALAIDLLVSLARLAGKEVGVQADNGARPPAS